MSDKNNKGLVLIGGGGHCRAIIDVIESITAYSVSFGGKIQIAKIVDFYDKLGHDIIGKYSVNALMEDLLWLIGSERLSPVLAFGQILQTNGRPELFAKIKSWGGVFPVIVSPFARVSPYSSIGEGTVVMHNAIINAGAVIGKGCIINTGAIIEHDAFVGDFTHISTGAVVNGGCRVGYGCFMGSNSTMLNNITICDTTVVGAASVITKHINEQNGIYVGNPATFLRSNNGQDNS